MDPRYRRRITYKMLLWGLRGARYLLIPTLTLALCAVAASRGYATGGGYMIGIVPSCASRNSYHMEEQKTETRTGSHNDA
jgi:hypothetical protein